MRILVLAQGACSDQAVCFGAGRTLQEHAKRWVEAGCSVRVLASHRPMSLPKEEVIDGVEITRFGSLYDSIPTMRRLYRAQADWADAVVENLLSFPLQTPLYVRRPLVVFSHHLLGALYIRAMGPVKGSIGYIFERALPLVYGRTPFLTSSHFHARQLAARGIPANNVTVVHSSVDTSYFTPGERAPKPLLFFVGSFADGRKRVEHLVESFFVLKREFPNLELVIAGKGGGREKALVRLIGAEPDARFVGLVNEDEKRELYRRSWVFVNPSLMEGFSLTAIEANACGTPVVAYRIPGLETLVDGETGLLADHDNPASLVEKIRSLLGNADLRQYMGARGVGHARGFSWDTAAGKSLALLERLAGNARSM